MSVQFIPVTLENFEEQFNIPSKKNPEQRAFNLIRPQGSEAYYECKLKETKAGQLILKVYTSIRSDKNKARDVGEDAIRIVVLWADISGWNKPIGEKSKRIYRSGGINSTAYDVIERAFKRSKEIAIEAMRITICYCGRPMIVRKGINGDFLGCIGYSKNVCKGTRSI